MGQLIRDGVALFCEDAGKGAPPLLFIHDLGADHTAFAPQFTHFRRDHRVVALDLRGHGQSAAPPQGYTLAGLADDLAWMCVELGLYQPVFVGHGLGGMLAMACAASHPDLPAAIVVLDAPLPPTAATRAGCQRVLQALRGSDAPAARRQLLESHRPLAVGPQRAAQVLENTAYLSPQATLPLWESLCAWDACAALASCRLPLLYLAVEPPLADLPRLRELCPQVIVSRLPAVAQDPPVAAPAQVNDPLERFLRKALS
jgi:pimeloyl-ACP methyl ester carboxylesterase